MKTNTYKVLNMNCNHCVANITKALKGLPGVEDLAFNLKVKEVEVQGDISSEVVIKAIEDAGYDVEV
ncbi:heavy-metal-associated domain-containing protein [bacterium]|nr:heavy-metal-associated domain-containing protein [bacterium]